MLYDEIMKIVTLAGELMLQAQDEELTVFDKEGTANFVTKHDKEIQFYLIQNLRQLIPEATFLAEEDGMQQELGDGYCFIIDPIDGTTNFIFDYKHSCISVGSNKVWKNAVWLCLQPLHKRNVFRCERRRGEAERKRDSLFG